VTPPDVKDEGLLLAISAAIDLVTERNNAPYDGVLGRPPADCITPTLDADFLDARNRVLDEGYTVERALAWLRDYRALGSGKGGRVSWPAEFENEMRTLALVQAMVDDGPELGMKRYLGERQYKRVGKQDRRDQMDRINKPNTIPPERRALVHELHEQLSATITKKTALYDEIATRTGVKPRTVRDIVEGRKKKS
jgi:hypothetical protein